MSPSKTVVTNTYKYKLSSTDITLPKLGDKLSNWTTWDGTSEITATNGYYIAVAEVDGATRCDKVGKTTVVAKTENAET